MTTKGKVTTWITAIIIVALGVFLYFKFWFVFGEGVKAGELNQFMYKGWIWKTYEGRLIQSGFRGSDKGNSVQSNEFNFSVVEKGVADTLMHSSGQFVELHYKEYNGWLPWRGMRRHVVDKIISIKPGNANSTIPILPQQDI